jgi:hypothetical protein
MFRLAMGTSRQPTSNDGSPKNNSGREGFKAPFSHEREDRPVRSAVTVDEEKVRINTCKREVTMATRIKGSVGERGNNHKTDVVLIQSLMNKYRASKGLPAITITPKPTDELARVIKDFQKEQFAWQQPDGRVDPGGPTLKLLNSLTDPRRSDYRLLEPTITRQNGKYKLTMGADGEIRAKAGDWLSKYSAAINDNFYTIWPYMRPNADGQFVAVRNVNLIYENESLYHIPTFLAFYEKNRTPPPAVPPVAPISEEEKKKITAEIAAREFGLQGENLAAAKAALEFIQNADSAATIAEVFAAFAEGSVLAAAASALAIGGVAAGLLASMIDFLNSLQKLERITGLRAVAYGTVSWAFNEARPGFSPQLLKRMNEMAGALPPSEFDRCKLAWQQAVDSAYREMEKMALGPRGKYLSTKSAEALRKAGQAKLRRVSDGNKRELCRKLLVAFEKQFKGTLLEAWQKGYEFLYPE